MPHTTRFELYTLDGNLLFQGIIVERDTPAKEEIPVAAPPKEPSGGHHNGNGKMNGDLMTSPQMRKLFRLMASKGREGEQAHEELKKLFRVETLKDVTKIEASNMIDRLLTEPHGGNGHGSSL